MKKMTRNLMKELLKDDNYNEALAFFANRIAKCKTYGEANRKREADYNKVIEWAYDFEDEDGENDFSNNVLRIDSAMFCIIEEEF